MLEKIKNRKGMSHIEVILSFIIFVGFFIFLIAIFNPFKTSSKEVYVDSVERGIRENASIEVKFLPLRLNISSGTILENCICFDCKCGFEKVIAKDKDYKVVEAKINENNACINGKQEFYYIYSNENFVENVFNGNCKNLQKNEYTLGLFRTYDFVSFPRLEALVNAYNSDEGYDNIKKSFGLVRKDFMFDIRETDTKALIIGAGIDKKIPRAKVAAKTIPVQLVYRDGSFKYVIMNIRVW